MLKCDGVCISKPICERGGSIPWWAIDGVDDEDRDEGLCSRCRFELTRDASYSFPYCGPTVAEAPLVALQENGRWEGVAISEADDFEPLSCVYLHRFECEVVCVATITRPYSITDLARSAAGCAASFRIGNCNDVGSVVWR